MKGGELINDKRKNAGLQPLDILPIPLLEDGKLIQDCCEEEEKKISSSNYRMRLLGTLIKQPQVINKTIIFIDTYVIFITFFPCSQILIFQNILILLD